MEIPKLHQDHPLRVIVLTKQRLVAEMVKLTLNHGVYVTRDARDLDEAGAIVAEWHPQIAIIDMDAGGDQLVRRIGKDPQRQRTRIPILALTRRGDLRTKLAAFDLGVDDIMTIPISPEELLARVLVITRRSMGRSVPSNPVIKIGEIEIVILNRHVRAAPDRARAKLVVLPRGERRADCDPGRDSRCALGIDFVAESNVVDRHIRSLRIKLHDDWCDPRFIATVPGQRYRFIPTLAERQIED